MDGVHVGLPESLTSYILDENSHLLQKRSSGYNSGCQDNFAIFAFLAFALAVLDVILEMNARRRRDTDYLMNSANTSSQTNATLATYAMFRGFLNMQDTEDEQCQQLFMCESSLEASYLGHLSEQIARLTGEKAKSLIENIEHRDRKDLQAAMESGLRGQSCHFRCRDWPESYRYPGVSFITKDEEYQEMLDAMRAVQPLQEKIHQDLLSNKIHVL